MKCTIYLFILLRLVLFVESDSGLMLLYKPRDISQDCAYSNHLYFELSFGMGMSDTITLVLRTLREADYECFIEIITDSMKIIIVVVKYPNKIGVNCAANKDAFIVMKKNKCLYLCDSIGERDVLSPFFVFVVEGRVRMRFLSNSSINSDLQANVYQVTATAARKMPFGGCNKKNETFCSVDNRFYCFTSGVVCDGIINCGVNDWFDERKSDCGLAVERLGFGPVIAVCAALLCAMLAAGRILLRCLPPLANSFFIFNANEDNRLCIDPMLQPPGSAAESIELPKKLSLIPVSSSSSDPDEKIVKKETIKTEDLEDPGRRKQVPYRKNTMKNMAKKFQNKFCSTTKE